MRIFRKMSVRFLLLFASGVLLLAQSCSVASVTGATGDGGDCTSGFPSLERINAALGNYGDRTIFGTNIQVVIPSINFTCSGSIQSWIFGGQWLGTNTDSLTELQIWRPDSEGGSYTKVGSTIINVTEGTQGEFYLYDYPLTTPLLFEAGDILGYYLSGNHLRLVFEDVGSGHLSYFMSQDNATNQFTEYQESRRYHVLISVATDSPGCGCGSMSVERMRLLLGLDTTGNVITTQRRQQITPDMRFTCDGMITKWIIAANWVNKNDDILYPELQLWRSSGNDTVYQKISGTVIDINTESTDRIYEYPVSPIPFQAGDILGIFIPRHGVSKIRLRSESGTGPTNYYISTDNSVTMSPFDIQHNTLIWSSTYYPLVTVEIVVNSSPTSLIATETDMSSTTSFMTATISTSSTIQTDLAKPFTRPHIATGVSTFHPTTTPRSYPDGNNSVSVRHISMGVAGAVLVLVAVTVIVISLTVCLHLKRKYYMNVESSGAVANRNYITTSSNSAYGVTSRDEDSCVHNVAYGVSHKEVELSDNVAYHGVTQKKVELSDNVAYHGVSHKEVELSDNVAYHGVTQKKVELSDNVAYGVTQKKVELSDNVAYGVTQKKVELREHWDLREHWEHWDHREQEGTLGTQGTRGNTGE